MEPYSRFVVTPWRDRQELIQLRRDLYRLDADSADRRQGAVNKVLAWRARHESLPLLLESTADIVDVILQDEVGTLEHNATRLLYATAISRFITGYLDTQIDLTRDRPSWFPPGKALQPPISLLEVRHCIVHRHMPCLAELKRAARTALGWLWDWYWTQLDHAFGLAPSLTPPETEASTENNVDRLHSILKTYVRSRKQEIKAKRRADLCTSAATAWTTYTLRFAPGGGTTLPSTATQNALLGLLVAEPSASIVPADRKPGSTMQGAFLVWSLFLRLFCSKSPTFFPALLALVVAEMNDTARSEAHREALCEWAVNMLVDREWREVRGSAERAVREKVLGECVTELGTWNLRLAEGILGTLEEGEKDMWSAILDASRAEGGDGGGAVEKGEREHKEDEMEVDLRDEEESVDEAASAEEDEPAEGTAAAAAAISIKEKIRGPQKVVGLWKPKPIGWLPDNWDEDA